MSQTIIETERLILRRFEKDDVHDLLDLLGDPEVMRFSLSGPYDREKCEDFLEKTLTHYEKKDYGLWAVIYKGEKKVIGYCGIVDQDIDGESLPEIGYRLNRSYWGRGLASEAASAVQHYGFNVLQLKKMISVIEAENIASIKVAEKNGLVHEKDSLFHNKIPVRIYSISSN